MSFGDRIDALRLFVGQWRGSHPRAGELAQVARALTYVGLSAALEEFLRGFVDELMHEISSARVRYLDLQLGVVSLAQAGAFDSVAARRRQDKWDKRAEILSMTVSPSAAVLPSGLRPLDGRTIKQDHLETLWLVFGLPGSPFPSPLHIFALNDLSEGRNEVAHGNSDPVVFGRRKAYGDVLRRMGQVEDICVHVAITGSEYIESAGYLR